MPSSGAVPEEDKEDKEGEKHQERYSEEFVEKVKAEFPDSESLHNLLDSGNEWVGRHLDDESRFTMKPEDVDKAIRDGESEGVIKAVERGERIYTLYVEWGKSLSEITTEEQIEESVESVKKDYESQ